MRLLKIALVAAIFLPTATMAATFDRFSEVVVFGDSLSDPSVALPPTFYPNGQVTNGDTWATQLGFDDPTTNNFAVAGATAKADGSGDFLDQIATFAVTLRTLGDSALAAVWFGGNDVADALNSANPIVRIQEAIAAMAQGLDQLAREGFDSALVFLSPDIGDTPRVKAIDQALPGTATSATVISTIFNSQLLNIGALLSEPLELAFVDIPTIAAQTKANGASLGFTNLDDACLLTDPLSFAPGCSLAAAESYFYYDPFHPTDRTHAIIASAAAASAEQLAPVPVPAGFWLMGTVFAALGLTTRRRRKACATIPGSA